MDVSGLAPVDFTLDIMDISNRFINNSGRDWPTKHTYTPAPQWERYNMAYPIYFLHSAIHKLKEARINGPHSICLCILLAGQEVHRTGEGWMFRPIAPARPGLRWAVRDPGV